MKALEENNGFTNAQGQRFSCSIEVCLITESLLLSRSLSQCGGDSLQHRLRLPHTRVQLVWRTSDRVCCSDHDTF